MPKKEWIKKVLVIGSGPIIIGQAAEFDYAGTQACRALKEEGIEVVLINSNPATIMTDQNMADKVYIEPLNADIIKKIVIKEKPDSVLPTLGGQTGLNLAMELAEENFWQENNVVMLGTSAESIKKAEDREEFKNTMLEIGEPVIESEIVNNIENAVSFASVIGYPVIVRPAYTLGGSGGGIAENENELRLIGADGLRRSRVHQVLIEKSVAGWKEIEYEVMRDAQGSCITVCNMENIDPVGVHTGDSIVVAPSQTLRDREYQMLRSSAIKIINSLKIEGGCNVQYALDPYSLHYYLIEVNPRVSRSSALASKATGYPIARVAAKIAIGYNLEEIKNGVTGKTCACFEPALDYVTVKIPRFPFDKFVTADKSLGTRMKATGEVMAIGANYTEAFLKAIRSLEQGVDSLEMPYIQKMSDDEIEAGYHVQSDERIFFIAEALRRGTNVKEICSDTKMDLFFVSKLWQIVQWEEDLKRNSLPELSLAALQRLKHIGFADSAIARFTGSAIEEVYARRNNVGVLPTYKTVDTCAAEFSAESPYYYSTYQLENEVHPDKKKKIVVLGSGPIRIGQGIEFDYCSVHAIWALEQLGYQAIIINNNPETVSTDFDTSDRLYFEPLTPEDVINVLDLEMPDGVIIQFGGQTAIKLAKHVEKAGYQIMGTDAVAINKAEDREQFDEVLNRMGIIRPEGENIINVEDALVAANRLEYPVLVRPSYVLGGQGMEIAHNDEDIKRYMEVIMRTKQEHPILIDKYLPGKEIEVDAICDGKDILIPGIMEHIERAGVHSGDSISVYPAVTLSAGTIERIIEITEMLAYDLNIKGLMNIQFVEYEDEVYVIEVNPRSSRTVPYLSKVTGVPMIDLAVKIMLGEKLETLGYGTGLYPAQKLTAVKVPVFSFEKLPLLEISLGPEMKSTGEVLGLDYSYWNAVYKGFLGAGYYNIKSENLFISLSKYDLDYLLPLADTFKSLNMKFMATKSSCKLLRKYGFECELVSREGDMDEFFAKNNVGLIINTPTKGRKQDTYGFKLRQKAIEYSIPCLTSVDTALHYANALKYRDEEIKVYSLDEIVA